MHLYLRATTANTQVKYLLFIANVSTAYGGAFYTNINGNSYFYNTLSYTTTSGAGTGNLFYVVLMSSADTRVYIGAAANANPANAGVKTLNQDTYTIDTYWTPYSGT